jgi:maleamate amidohydrolase
VAVCTSRQRHRLAPRGLFTDPNATLGSNLDAQIEATHPLEVAHERKIPVFFSACVYDDPEFRDAASGSIKSRASIRSAPGPRTRRSIPGWTSAKAILFFQSAMRPASRLTAQRIDTVILTGRRTSGCVRATAVESCQYDFRPIFFAAVGDRSKAAHEQSLFDLVAKYADVTSLSDALEYIEIGRPQCESVMSHSLPPAAGVGLPLTM